MARKWNWGLGAAVLGAVGLAQWGLSKALPQSRDVQSYEQSRLPFFAPPREAFPIAWTINVLCLSAGLVRVLNLPESRRGRSRFLQSQIVAWALFSTFNAAYFGLRSPINAAAITLLYSAATAFSVKAALDTDDTLALASLATTVLWLALAAPLSVTQALWNHDPFWKAGPFVQPPRG